MLTVCGFEVIEDLFRSGCDGATNATDPVVLTDEQLALVAGALTNQIQGERHEGQAARFGGPRQKKSSPTGGAGVPGAGEYRALSGRAVR